MAIDAATVRRVAKLARIAAAHGFMPQRAQTPAPDMAEPDAPETVPILDHERLAKLTKTVGTNGVADFLTLFLEELEGQISGIEAGVLIYHPDGRPSSAQGCCPQGYSCIELEHLRFTNTYKQGNNLGHL